MAIPFNVPSEEQSESQWVVQFQMIFKRNILNLLNEMASIRDNNATYPDRLPDSSPPPTDQAVSETDGASVVPTPSTFVVNPRAVVDWTSRQSTDNNSEIIHTNLNSHILLSSALNSRNGTLATGLTHTESVRRSRRQRTSSESSSSSSSCDERKNGTILIYNAEEPVEPAQHDWTQVGTYLRQIAGDFNDTSIEEEEEVAPARRSKKRCKENTSLFSKIMPASIKNSIWTAVICVIGWHLFRAR